MDPIKAEKVQAMSKYRRSGHYYFVHSLILHLLVGLGCSLVFSSPYWLPCLCSSTKQFLLISLPCIWTSFFSPKCLFVVVNVIVIFLVGESRLVGSNTSSQVGDIYDEYVKRSRSLRGLTPQQNNKVKERVEEETMEKEAEIFQLVNKNKAEEDEEEVVEVKEVITTHEAHQEVKLSNDIQVKEEGCLEKGRDVVEEEGGLPVEELNKRVEEFIARVNKQRWMESHLLVCCRA